MSEKPTIKPSNGDEKMAAQINEIYSKFHMIENLLSDLAPALGKIAKDTQPHIKDLREKFERDETLDLIKKVGDNIPTFLELFDMMKIVKGMMTDLMPAVGKVADDASPVIKDMRERFEREETLSLLMKVGDNIPTFLQLFDMMKIVKGMMTDLMPAVEKIADDASPLIKDMRERFEREETLSLLMKVGDNIPTFLQLFDMMKIVKGMMTDLMPAVEKIADDASPLIKDMRERFEREETIQLLMKVGDNIPFLVQVMGMMDIAKGLMIDLAPAVEKITHDVSPTITQLREKYEREETLELIMKLGDDIPVLIILLDLLGKEEIPGMLNKIGGLLPVFDKLVDSVNDLNKSGSLNTVAKMLSYKDVSYLIGGVDKCLVSAMADIKTNPVKPGITNLISAVMDPEVQKGLLILMKFAKYLPKSLSEAMQEIG